MFSGETCRGVREARWQERELKQDVASDPSSLSLIHKALLNDKSTTEPVLPRDKEAGLLYPRTC